MFYSGRRHRSIIRYCAQKLGSIKFVVSKEGVINCIIRLENNLVMLENLSKKPVDFVEAGFMANRKMNVHPGDWSDTLEKRIIWCDCPYNT